MLRASGESSFERLGPRRLRRDRRRERDVEPVGEVAGPVEHGLQLAAARRRLVLAAAGGARRQQRHHDVDVVGVAERVERELERLAPHAAGRAPRDGVAGDRAARAEPVERVHHAVALEQLDVAADRRGAHRHVERDRRLGDLEPLASTATSWSPLPSRYFGPTCSAICLAIADVVLGGRRPGRPAVGHARRSDDASSARIDAEPDRPPARCRSARRATKPKRGR